MTASVYATLALGIDRSRRVLVLIDFFIPLVHESFHTHDPHRVSAAVLCTVQVQADFGVVSLSELQCHEAEPIVSVHRHQRILRVLLSTHLRKDLEEVLHDVLCRLAQWNVLNDQFPLEVGEIVECDLSWLRIDIDSF